MLKTVLRALCNYNKGKYINNCQIFYNYFKTLSQRSKVKISNPVVVLHLFLHYLNDDYDDQRETPFRVRLLFLSVF